MGQKISDGKAFDAAAPSGQVINDYDLYRINGWNGCAIGAKDGTQTDRTLSFECDPAAIYSVLFPTGITGVTAGNFYFWTTNDLTTFQRGDTHLTNITGTTGGIAPCFHALGGKNAAGYVRGRVMQSPGTATKFGT